MNYVPNKFVIIDGSSLLYRAFYALPLLETAGGVYTNAAYGFATMLVKLIGDLKPDLLGIAFDKGKKTFRNEMYADYKGTRKPTPPELSAQIPLIHDLVDAFGVKQVEENGFEADDIIGTLSKKAAEAGCEVVIVTGDRDALQLIGPDVKVMLTKKGISDMQLFDAAAFAEKYGLPPAALIDMKGLMGDSSDNIPGVPGVGEKTALKLLLAYQSLENVLAHIDEISGKKLQERLREHRDLAILSKRLATICRDMDLAFEEDEYKIMPDVAKLKAFCARYEFRSVLPRIDSLFPNHDDFGFGTVVEALAPEYRVADDPEEARAMLAAIEEEKILTFFPILEGAVPFTRVKGMMAAVAGEIVYFDATPPVWENVIELFADAGILKITHDFKRLHHAGLGVKGPIFDTMLAAYLLEPSENRYQLENLVEFYLNQYNHPESYENDKARAAWSLDCVMRLYQPLKAKLEAASLSELYHDVELPLANVLCAMERAGITVNRGELERMADEIKGKVESLLAEIYALAGTQFNVNSTKQLGEILFERLALPADKKTKRGYSTDAEVLEKLESRHPIIRNLLDYRVLTKLKSTYLDGLKLLICEETDRIHTNFNQTATATGRLSSSEPNLQNIPVRTEAGKRIRELFVPGDGFDYLMSADYSQIELRVLAHMSGDRNFVEAFSHGQDIHTRTASEVFGVPMDAVSPELRGRAKAVNFGIVYGISDYGLARDLGVTRKEAGLYIESYFEKCAGVKAFIDASVEKARKDGFVTTLFGRRRYLPEINSGNYNQRSFAERIAMNTPIQGTAADIIKKAMIDVYRELKRANLRSRILLQVHDELVLEVAGEETERVAAILRAAMQQAAKLSVPLTIDINIGDNWAKAK